MLDVIIRGGTVVDGTGAPGAARRCRHPRRAHRGDRRRSTSRRPATIDADGKVVAPGFVDIHTHYDAQVFWDTTLSPVAAARRHDRDRRQLRLHDRAARSGARRLPDAHARAGRGHAGRPRSRKACRGTGRSFGEYLDKIDGTLAPNAGFLVGHSTIRRVVMGERATQGRGDRRRPRGDASAARREPGRGRPRLLVVVGAHAQRRRGRHGAVALRDRGRDSLALCSVVSRAPGHDARVHPVRRPVRGLRRRPDDADVARGEPAAQLERAVRRQGQRGDGRAQPRRRPTTRAERGAHGARADDARSRRRRASASTAASCSTRSRAGRSRWRSPTTRRRRCSRAPDGRAVLREAARAAGDRVRASRTGASTSSTRRSRRRTSSAEGSSVADIAKERGVDDVRRAVRHRRGRRPDDRLRVPDRGPTTTRLGGAR